MKYRVLYSPEARDDARAIQSYLRQFSSRAPVRFKDTLRGKLKLLKENPYLYEKYRYQPKYRSIAINKYLLFCEMDEEQGIIYVYRILHGTQDIPSYL